MVAQSVLMSDLHSSTHVRRRVYAIAQNARWDTPNANVEAPFDLDQVMWGVVSHDALMEEVKNALSNAEPDDQHDTNKALAAITEDTLVAAVLASITRLYPKWKDPKPA